MVLSSEDRRNRAIAEVHAHRPEGQQVVTTIEFDHPGMDEPARVVADNDDLEAALESGEIVTFKAVAFRHAGPAQGDSRWPEIELTIDGAAGILEPHLEAALGLDAPIMVTVRDYLRQSALDGPGRVIAGLELDNTKSGDLSVTGTAGFYGLDRKFGTTYDPSTYPGLR